MDDFHYSDFLTSVAFFLLFHVSAHYYDFSFLNFLYYCHGKGIEEL